MPEADFMEGPAFFMVTFHARGRFHGRSVLFHGDLPCWRLILWKVGAFSWGPSMPEGVFMEGRRIFVVTFHARGRFHGRSALFHGDLPCWRLISRKVGAFSWGPSMPGAVYMEGRCFFVVTFHTRGRFYGRSEVLSDLVFWDGRDPYNLLLGAAKP